MGRHPRPGPAERPTDRGRVADPWGRRRGEGATPGPLVAGVAEALRDPLPLPTDPAWLGGHFPSAFRTVPRFSPVSAAISVSMRPAVLAAINDAQLDRDRAIVTARDSGATWAAIQRLARMSSPRAVAKAIARAEEAN